MDLQFEFNNEQENLNKSVVNVNLHFLTYYFYEFKSLSLFMVLQIVNNQTGLVLLINTFL